MKKKLMKTLATITLMMGFLISPVSSVYAATLDEAIDGATAKMLADGKISSDWEAFAVARSNTPASKELRQEYYNQIVEYLNSAQRLSATDYERTIIGVLSVGGDPTNIKEATTHKNLVEELYRMNVTTAGTNAIIYGILALQTKDYEVPDDALFSVQDLVGKLVSLQKADGGWTLFGSTSDVDITGMAMTGLAKYKDMPGVEDALNKSIAYLSSVQLESGGFKGWSNENSNSLSQAIMGMTMTGNDPTGPLFTKSVHAIDALMTYRTNDGGFKWLLTDADSNSMALDQAAYALAQYKTYLNGTASIYDFVNNPVPLLADNPEPNPNPTPDPTPVPEPEPIPEPEPEPIPNPTPEPTEPKIEEPVVKDSEKPENVIPASATEAAKKTADNSSGLPKTGESYGIEAFTVLLGSSFILFGSLVFYENKKNMLRKHKQSIR